MEANHRHKIEGEDMKWSTKNFNSKNLMTSKKLKRSLIDQRLIPRLLN